jgi:hypothetical protein
MFRNIFEKLTEHFKNGADNTPQGAHHFKNFDYLRRFRKGLFEHFDEWSLDKKIDKEIFIAKEVLTTIFAVCLQLGCCHEQASVVWLRLLEAGVTAPLELIEISGPPLERAFEKAEHKYDIHNFTLVGRSPTSNIKDISTWKNVSVIDTWNGGFFKKYEEKESPVETDLTRDYFSIERIQLHIRIDRPLNKNEWNNIVCILIATQQYINDLFPYCFRNDREKVNKMLADKIHLYKMFSALPIGDCITQTDEKTAPIETGQLQQLKNLFSIHSSTSKIMRDEVESKPVRLAKILQQIKNLKEAKAEITPDTIEEIAWEVFTIYCECSMKTIQSLTGYDRNRIKAGLKPVDNSFNEAWFDYLTETPTKMIEFIHACFSEEKPTLDEIETVITNAVDQSPKKGLGI